MDFNHKRIFLGVSGSTLYGTNTPASDLDLKGIYQASFRDIILKRDEETICLNSKDPQNQRQNNNEDVDCSYKELRRYIKDCISGQTYAIEMLFTPEQYIKEQSDLWKEIISLRHLLLNKNITAAVHYCRNQAEKYSNKGVLLQDLKNFLSILESIKDPYQTRLYQILDNELLLAIPGINLDFELKFLELGSKKFQFNFKIIQIIGIINKYIKRYGQRSEEARLNSGADFKALSHAFRVIYQVKELLQNHQIIFPLKEAKFLLDIKLGKIDYESLKGLLESEFNSLVFIQEQSTLPENVSLDFWDEKMLQWYKNN